MPCSRLDTWTTTLARVSKAALDAGIDERRVRMQEAGAQFIASVIRAAIDTCSDDETRAAAVATAAKLMQERGLQSIP